MVNQIDVQHIDQIPRRAALWNRLGLTIVFTLSFVGFLRPEVSTTVQLAPLILFSVLVFCRVIFWGPALTEAISSLLTTEAVLFIFAVALLTAPACLFSTLDLSPGYWALMTGMLVLARLYMSVVPLREVFDAFYWSAILSLGLFVPLTYNLLIQSIQNMDRFSPFSFHPNLVGFVMAGYVSVFAMKAIYGKGLTRIIGSLLSLLCLVFIFFASSRGSIVAVIVGALAVAALATLRARKERRTSLVRAFLVAALALSAILLFVRYSPWTKDMFDFTDQVLQLTQADRGLDSGLTGRFDRWNMVLKVFSDETWVVGRGLRFTDTLEPMIDNSYLVLLYEIGLIPTLLIMSRFLYIAATFVLRSFRETERSETELCLMCSLLLVVLLVNNIVARLLFGVGNPFSLLAFLLFAAPYSRRRVTYHISQVVTA